MDGQQIIALSVVGVASVYLGRNAVRAFKAFRYGKGGCAEGCGKCGYASHNTARPSSPRANARPDIISLTDIKTISSKRDS